MKHIVTGLKRVAASLRGAGRFAEAAIVDTTMRSLDTSQAPRFTRSAAIQALQKAADGCDRMGLHHHASFFDGMLVRVAASGEDMSGEDMSGWDLDDGATGYDDDSMEYDEVAEQARRAEEEEYYRENFGGSKNDILNLGGDYADYGDYDDAPAYGDGDVDMAELERHSMRDRVMELLMKSPKNLVEIHEMNALMAYLQGRSYYPEAADDPENQRLQRALNWPNL
jgi:hypothetical protein